MRLRTIRSMQVHRRAILDRRYSITYAVINLLMLQGSAGQTNITDTPPPPDEDNDIIPMAIITISLLVGAFVIGTFVARGFEHWYMKKSLRDDASDISEYTQNMLKVQYMYAFNRKRAMKIQNGIELARHYAKIWRDKAAVIRGKALKAKATATAADKVKMASKLNRPPPATIQEEDELDVVAPKPVITKPEIEVTSCSNPPSVRPTNRVHVAPTNKVVNVKAATGSSNGTAASFNTEKSKSSSNSTSSSSKATSTTSTPHNNIKSTISGKPTGPSVKKTSTISKGNLDSSAGTKSTGTKDKSSNGSSSKSRGDVYKTHGSITSFSSRDDYDFLSSSGVPDSDKKSKGDYLDEQKPKETVITLVRPVPNRVGPGTDKSKVPAVKAVSRPMTPGLLRAGNRPVSAKVARPASAANSKSGKIK